MSADIFPGELVMAMGPSGSGKTTLLNLIGGLRSATEGTLRVLDEELRSASQSALHRLRRRIGFIFQQHHLLNSLTVQQNVEMGVSGASPSAARGLAETILSEVGLKGLGRSHPKQLSGGQRQRVAIARALVRKPQLLLADEPTASLDSATGREVMELLRQLARRQGCAVMIVTHDNRILDMADRLMYLEDGRLSSFASVTSAHAAHALTALRPLALDGSMGAVLEKMNDAEFLDITRTLAAESEQFLNVLGLGDASDAAPVITQCARSVIERVSNRAGGREAIVWLRRNDGLQPLLTNTGTPPDPSPAALDAMRDGVTRVSNHSLFMPLQNTEYEYFAVAEIRGDALTNDAEHTLRDFNRPLGVIVQLCSRLRTQ